MASEVSGESATARRVIALLSLTVIVAVAIVLYVIPRTSAPGGAGPDSLATLNAGLNAASAILLLSGFAFIRARRIEAHRACMVSAFGLSAIFLVTYLLHHAKVGSVRFHGGGLARA